MNKIVVETKNVVDKIVHAVDTIANPIRQTLSPKGGNVLIQKDNGTITLTNDGATIAKSITVEDEFEDSIIEIVKSGSLKTNAEAGDGTSSTVVLSQFLIKEGLKLKEDGYNPIAITKVFNQFKDNYLNEIKKHVNLIKTDSDLFNIAKISANNDSAIAEDVVKAIKIVGQDGMVFITPNTNSVDTVIDEELGFKIDSGILYKELLLNQSQFSNVFTDIPVLITDKRLYYEQEAETILRVISEAGYNSVAIVARDFIGQSVPLFITNHTKGSIKVCLIKDPKATETDSTSLDDLAVYTGGKVVTDKTGSIVNKLKIEDFVLVNRIYTDTQKTLITPKILSNKLLKARVKSLRDELAKDKNNETLKKRISSLTSGIVTMKVGGATPIEMNEKIYRYEDAVNATRQAQLNGYVTGGGVTMLKNFNTALVPDQNFVPLFAKYSQVIIRQIAENCGEHIDTVLRNVLSNQSKYFGYNAVTGEYTDLIKAGVIEPLKVVEMAISNSISIANVILSTNYYVVNDIKEDEGSK